MRRVAILLAAGLLAGCASQADTSSPAERNENISVGVTASGEPVEITVDTGDQELGAYTLVVAYDRAVVRVASVEGGPDFAAPNYGRAGLRNGELRLLGVQTQPGPRGRTVVARIRFELVGSGSSNLGVRLETLVDFEERPIRGKAEASRDRVP